MTNTNPADLNVIIATDKQAQALQLKLKGLTYEQIAVALGYASKSGAHYAVKAGLQKTLEEPAEELRELEVQRLDTIQAAIWAKAEKGDLAAVDRVLRISERRSKLLGLDLPITFRVETDNLEIEAAAPDYRTHLAMLAPPEESEDTSDESEE